MKDKNLYFFTYSYPYSGESFVGNELKALSEHFNKIYLFTELIGNKIVADLPRNIETKRLNNIVKKSSFKIFFSNLKLIFSVFYLDFIKNQDKMDVLKKLRYNLALLIDAISLSEKLGAQLSQDPKQKELVAFWMDKWTLVLSVLKYKNKIDHFVFRVHQHDLFIDENPKQYMPFRFFNIQMSSSVFPDSERGVKYLKAFNFYPEKIKLGHLGVFEKGTNPFQSDAFTLVSCSALVSRKRVDKIVEVLSLINFELNWIHFGADGDSPAAFDQFKEKCKNLPANIHYTLKGNVSYEELIAFYQNTPVNLFITLTRAEGLPVSVIEAVSFGIPVLATDIMGIPDIVNENTGILIEPNLPAEKIAMLIVEFKSGSLNTINFRSNEKQFWYNNFEANLNCTKFIRNLNSL